MQPPTPLPTPPWHHWPGHRPGDPRPAPARTISVLIGLAICVASCSIFGEPKPEPELDAAARDQRIETLKTAIEMDHVRLTTLITEPRGASAVELHEDPEIERIAHRLNQNERELDALLRSARNESR